MELSREMAVYTLEDRQEEGREKTKGDQREGGCRERHGMEQMVERESRSEWESERRGEERETRLVEEGR